MIDAPRDIGGKWRVGAGTTLLLILGTASWGQEPPQGPHQAPKDVADLSLEQLMEIRIDEVQGASRYVQKIREAPASVTVITAEEIRRHGWRTLAEALRSLPGVWISGDRNYSYLGTRGFGFPADFNGRILFLLDGHRVNDNVYDGALIGGEFVLDPDLIERVEFIRGPGSCLYGSSAFFGIVNIRTRRATAVGGVELSLGAGSHRAFQGRATWGATPREGVGILLSASAFASRGRDLEFPELAGPSGGTGRVRGADGEFYHSLFGRLRLKDLRLSAAYVSREKTVPTAPYDTAFPSRDTATWDDRAFLDARYERRFEGGPDLLARLFFDGYWYRGNYEYEDESTGARYLNKDVATGYGWGAEFKLGLPLFGERLKTNVGAEFRDEFRQDQENFDDVHPRTVYLDSREDSRIRAAYAQVEAVPLPWLRLNAGLRFDHYDSFGGSLNPRATLIVEPLEGTVLKALYGRAFRAPSAYERYYEDSGVFQKANPDLDPETISTCEAILEQEIARGIRLSLGAFHYRAEDLIRPVLDPADDLQYFDNTGKVCGRGGEAVLTGRLESGLEGRISYSYQHARDAESGEWLPNSPKHLAKLNASVPVVPGHLFGGLEFQYMSRRRTLAGDHTDAVALINLTLFSRNVLKGLELSASVYNIFDEKYADPAGSEHRMDQIEQDGRSYWVKLTYRF